MDRTSLARIRQKYKTEMVQKLQWLTNTPKWKEYIECANLQDFDIVFADKTHYEPLLKLLTKNYFSSNPWLSLFPPTNADKPPAVIVSKLKFVTHENGCAVVAIDKKTNEIAACAVRIDVCDLTDASRHYYKEFSVCNNDDNDNTQYIGQLIGKLYEDGFDPNIKDYGNQSWGGMSFVDKKYQMKKLMFILITCHDIILTELGYKRSYGEATHRQIGNIAKAKGFTLIKSVEWKNFTFSDGKSMEYFLKKLNEKYNQTHIKNVLKNCVMELWVQENAVYDKSQKNAYAMYIDKNINLLKRIQKLNKYQSKL